MDISNYLVFLGTGGGRWVMMSQIRRTAGLFFNFSGKKILIDPGPGLIAALKVYNISITNLDLVVLTHRHIDHSNDVNLALEILTNGTKKIRGNLIAPSDCFDDDPVIRSYLIRKIQRIWKIEEKLEINLDDCLRISFPLQHIHRDIESYGVKINYSGVNSVSLIADGQFSEMMIKAYANTDLLIINTTVPHDGARITHLDFNDAEELISGIKPKKAILTHFGITALKCDLSKIAENISKRTGVTCVCAIDGMKVLLS